MSGKLECGETIFNYDENTVTLSSFYGELSKATPDMINDFSTFNIQISLVVGEDPLTGEEIESVIYNCKATIFNDRLIIEDPSGNFTIDDFKTHPIGNVGVTYKTKNQTKVITLGTDIREEQEYNVTFFVDGGNFEDGTAGRSALNTSAVQGDITEIEKTQNVIFKVNQNPVIDNINLTIAIKDLTQAVDKKIQIKDITGKIVKEFSIPTTSTEQNFNFPTEGLKNGIYFMLFEYGDKEYGKKIIVDKK
jgi:hypothetical protein